jgi:GWxTD domain-containing protein
MIAMAGSFAFTVAAPDSGPARLPIPVFTQFAAAHLAPGSGVPLRPRAPLATWAVGIWLAGVLVLLLRRLGGWLAVRRLVARASVAAGEPWVALLDGLRQKMGIARAVALVESALVDSPAVIGWLKPVILVPAGWLLGLPAADAETVLLHELAHVRRHDYLVNLLQSAVGDLLFYHPAVWWVGRVIRREREHCCDDAVIAIGADRRVYARTLAALEGMRAGEPAVAVTGGSLAARIGRLVRRPEGPRASAVPLVLMTMLVCAGAAALHAWPQSAAAVDAPSAEAAMPEATVPDAPAPEAPAPPQATPLQGSPYEKWLTEDVAYIISDEERAAFRALQSNPERERFIEQFWERRDPTPGTPANEVKEEHYRRIAYANEKFAAGIPGWKTDRGRIYIVYGPPDEKEVHPSGDVGGPPYEEWLYKHNEGVGDRVIVKFVDEQRNGTFRQTIDPHDPRGPQLVKPRPVPRAAMTTPRVQSNGDYVYSDGPARVRVGDGGATLIAVAGSGVHVMLKRLGRHDLNSTPGLPAATLFRESADGPEFSKLVTLPRGIYELTGEVVEDAQMLNIRSRRAELEGELITARQAYTDSHPRVRALQAMVSGMEKTLLSLEGPRKYRVEFQVP